MLDFVLEVLMSELGSFIVELLGATKAERNPIGRAIIWAIAGVVFGGLSAVVFPTHFIHSEQLRLWNLGVSPVFVGGVNGLMAQARGRPAWSPAVSGACFAFAFAVARWRLAA